MALRMLAASFSMMLSIRFRPLTKPLCLSRTALEVRRLRLELMASAGFDPRESVQLWKNMAATGSGQPPEFLSTHPNPGSRIGALEEKMQVALPLYQKATPAECEPQ